MTECTYLVYSIDFEFAGLNIDVCASERRSIFREEYLNLHLDKSPEVFANDSWEKRNVPSKFSFQID